MTDLIERARRYIATMPPAVSGQGGHDATYTVATVLAHGFALPEADAWALLVEYNRTNCTPPWSEAELRHKLKDGYTKPHEGPRGHLRGPIRSRWQGMLSSPVPIAPTLADAKPQPQRPIKSIDLSKAVTVPAPMADATRALLRAVFNPGECVGIAQEVLGEDGHGIPKGGGATLPRDEWLKRLDARNGDPNQIFSSSDKTGAYVRINPLKAGGIADADVTAWRHVLLEWEDGLTKEQQWSVIEQSNLPCAAVLFSGRRSLHAWVKVDAANREEWTERMLKLYDYFERAGAPPDPKNKNPSRFSRLPGMIRGDGRQELLSLARGAASFAEWESSISELDLPQIMPISSFLSLSIAPPDELVKGLLHYGSKAVLGGGSKSHKTFALIDLALSVATGQPWWNLATVPARVLYCNFEVQDFFFQNRVRAIAGARGFDPAASRMDVWCLRGYSASVEIMIPRILRGIVKRTYGLIILDPIYKGLGDRDENKSGDMADLLNQVEYLAVQSGAAVAFGAHFSKGNQASKFAIDRISGSGVFARDPDTIMTVTAHEEEGCFTVESTLRNFAPLKPFVIRWKYPTFSVEDTIDPAKLAKPGKTELYSDEDILSVLRDGIKAKSADDDGRHGHYALTRTEFTDRVIEDLGGTKATFDRRIKELLRRNAVLRDTSGHYYTKDAQP